MGVVSRHLSWEGDKLAGMESTTDGLEVGQELLGSHVGVEQPVGMEVRVPQLVDVVTDELGHGAFSGIVRSESLHFHGAFRFMAGADSGGVVGNGRVGQEALQDGKGFPPCGSIGSLGLDDPDEVVVPPFPHHCRDVEEERVEELVESHEVIVSGLADDGLEGSSLCGKEGLYFLGTHGVMRRGRCRGIGGS